MCQKKTQSRIDCYANATSYYYLDIFGMLCFRTLGPWICAATQWQWYFMSGLYGQKYGIFKVTCLMHAFMGHEIGENIFFYKYSFLTVCPPKNQNGCRRSTVVCDAGQSIKHECVIHHLTCIWSCRIWIWGYFCDVWRFWGYFYNISAKILHK